jgi:hypothetical protein
VLFGRTRSSECPRKRGGPTLLQPGRDTSIGAFATMTEVKGWSASLRGAWTAKGEDVLAQGQLLTRLRSGSYTGVEMTSAVRSPSSLQTVSSVPTQEASR